MKMRRKHIIILLICIIVLLISFIASYSFFFTRSKPKIIDGGLFHAGFMYWCEMPLFQKDWYVIVAAELEEIEEIPCGGAHPDNFIMGTFRIHEVLQALPTKGVVFKNASKISTTGCEGLNIGDKVLIFVDEYDGGYGLVPVAGSNCRIGIKIQQFDAPIVSAVKTWIQHEGDIYEQAKLLLDAEYAAIWRQYGEMGIDYWLEMHHIPEYSEVLQNIEERRQGLATRYRQFPSDPQRAEVVGEAREVLFSAIYNDLLPQWFGTPWEFNGTTETPREGKIACGYFVTTILRDAGFELQRARLAQQPSELIIKSLTTETYIKRFSDASTDAFVDAIQEWGQGFYLVGLDIHTGFIINNTGCVSFVHSSYIEPTAVIEEIARESPILSSSKYRVLGKLSADDELIIKWLQGQTIPTKTR